MLRTTERREVISEMIIKALLDKEVPWRGDYGFPRNIISRLRYDGVNPLLLNLASTRHGWKTPFWGTYSQWACQGCTPKPRPDYVKIGEWAQEIVLYKPQISGKMVQELGRWSLFNLAQVDNGFADLRNQKPEVNYALADKTISATNAKIDFKLGTEAAYYYDDDVIVYPLREQFVNGPGGLPAYYNSLFHELMHWTEPRLGWEGHEPERELRAEIGADYLCTELYIPRLDMSKRTNHRKHIDRWVDLLRRDPDAIFRTTAAVSKGVDLILSHSKRVEPRHNPPAEVAA